MILLSEAGQCVLQNPDVPYRDVSHPRISFPLKSISLQRLANYPGVGTNEVSNEVSSAGGTKPQPAALTYFFILPCCKSIKIPTLASFLNAWLSVNRCIFSSECSVHPLSFIPQCCRLAFFTSQVTGVAITLWTLDCRYWQNESEGAGGEKKRVLFINNQGKL